MGASQGCSRPTSDLRIQCFPLVSGSRSVSEEASLMRSCQEAARSVIGWRNDPFVITAVNTPLLCSAGPAPRPVPRLAPAALVRPGLPTVLEDDLHVASPVVRLL